VIYRNFNSSYRSTTASYSKYQEKLLRGYYLTFIAFLLFLCLILILSSFE
jgi:hypothetical protein